MGHLSCIHHFLLEVAVTKGDFLAYGSIHFLSEIGIICSDKYCHMFHLFRLNNPFDFNPKPFVSCAYIKL